MLQALVKVQEIAAYFDHAGWCYVRNTGGTLARAGDKC